MQRIRTRLLALLTAAFVALPVQAFAHSSFFCHMSGEISHARCCPGKHVTESRDAHMQAPDCCELLESHSHPAPAARVNVHEAPGTAVIASIVIALAEHAEIESVTDPVAVETHPPGPPRFLANCSFLI